MPTKPVPARHIGAACGVLVAIAAAPHAFAQSASPPMSAPVTSGNPADPNPYYVGVAEALTHDSNVYRVPGGRSDNFSSTTLNAGFAQPIGRQRVFGAASVSLNRYQDQTTLNNTSYALSAGANWETIWHLSGDLAASLNRSLSAPIATAGATASVRNVADTRNVDAAVRWGGVSLLTLEANGGWSSVDYSGLQSGAADTRQSRAGLSLYLRPGGPLTLGVAGRFNQTETPRAINTSTGTAGDTVDGRNLDLLVGYAVSGFISTNARLSYTKQTSANVPAQDFSGLTGGLSVNWSPTAKTGVHFNAQRDAGSGTSLYGATPIASTAPTTPTGGAPTTPPITTPSTTFYENSRLTDSIAVGATHATTAKIGLRADARMSRARIAGGSALSGTGSGSVDTTDDSKTVSFGADYAITRFWNLACGLGREWRDVSGGVAFAYRANTISCSTQLTLR